MGDVEQKVTKRRKRENIRKAVLVTIKTAGVLLVAAAAPNALQLLKYTNTSRSRVTSRIDRSIKSMVARGMLKVRIEENKRLITLTRKGELLLSQIEAGQVSIHAPKKWDGKWRMVIFDIPERRKTARNKLRSFITALGFKKLQQSVWVHPYNCEDLITLLKTEYVLGKEVLYIVAEEIEHDHWLRKSFKLR